MERNEVVEWLKVITAAVVIALLVKVYLIESVRVSGASMEPTLHSGDGIIISKLSYKFSKPKVKDIVVFKYAQDSSQSLVKRVIATENERVKIEDGRVYINDKILEEPYIVNGFDGDFEEVVVPKNTIFVLGDNRPISKDSRYADVGFVSLADIIGKARFRFWPFNRFKVFTYKSFNVTSYLLGISLPIYL